MARPKKINTPTPETLKGYSYLTDPVLLALDQLHEDRFLLMGAVAKYISLRIHGTDDEVESFLDEIEKAQEEKRNRRARIMFQGTGEVWKPDKEREGKRAWNALCNKWEQWAEPAANSAPIRRYVDGIPYLVRMRDGYEIGIHNLPIFFSFPEPLLTDISLNSWVDALEEFRTYLVDIKTENINDAHIWAWASATFRWKDRYNPTIKPAEAFRNSRESENTIRMMRRKKIKEILEKSRESENTISNERHETLKELLEGS